jgi:hypothetical protein
MPLILIALLAIVGVVTWLLSTEGIWGAASTLLCVVVSGLFAMNFFEPAAMYLTHFVPAAAEYADFVSLVGIFAVLVTALRELTEYLAPVDIRVPDLLDAVGKWGFAAVTGYVTMAFLLTALHTAPLPREIFDFRPETPVFFGIAPDRQWLGFTQYVSEHSLQIKVRFTDPSTGKPYEGPNIFDGMVKKIGDAPNNVWSSFPIRYAMRRSQIERGEFVAGGGPAAKPPPPVPQPASGGGPAKGGF